MEEQTSTPYQNNLPAQPPVVVKKKKSFLVPILIAAIIVGIGIVTGVIFLSQKNKSKPTNAVQTITKNSIVSFLPKDKATNVGSTTPIVVTFKSPLSTAEKKSIQVSLSPQVEIQGTFSPDGKTFTSTPVSPLSLGKTYTVTLLYLDKPYTWSFSTISVPTESLEEQMQKQTQSDSDFGQKQKAIQDQYPWINNFPIMTNDYFIFFDVDKKDFNATIYPSKQSNISQADQVTQLKEKAMDAIKSKGVQLDNYAIEWSIEPR
jgi:hypothetical protein